MGCEVCEKSEDQQALTDKDNSSKIVNDNGNIQARSLSQLPKIDFLV